MHLRDKLNLGDPVSIPSTGPPCQEARCSIILGARANNYFKARSPSRDTETDHARAASVFRSIEEALDGAKNEQVGLKSRIDDVLARSAVTLGNASDEYLTRDPEDDRDRNWKRHLAKRHAPIELSWQ